MSKKKRVDLMLVERGLVENQTRAQALIMSGLVYTNTKRVDKAGQTLAEDADLTLKGKDHPWVSRGGQKLDHAIKQFDLDLKGKVVLDVGASTGGFTDVALHHGASRVYAVDVGHGQLAWSLRQDERVVVLERTNARHLTQEQVPESVDAVVCDASFIGLQVVLPAPMALTTPDAILVALIKPQFEVAKGQVGKGGVIRDPALHQEVCTRTEQWLKDKMGWTIEGITESPITGPEGNKEFLIVARKN